MQVIIALNFLLLTYLTVAAPATTGPGHLLLRQSSSPPLALPSCATFHARLGTRPESTDVYYLSSRCQMPDSISPLVPFDWQSGELIWIAPSSLDPELLQQRQSEIKELGFQRQIEHYTQQPLLGSSVPFDVYDGSRLVVELGSNQGRLVQISSYQVIQQWTHDPLHALDELVLISSESITRASEDSVGLVPKTMQGGELVSERDRQRVMDHITNLRFSPLISLILKSFHKKDIVADVRYLSGEDQSLAKSDEERWVSRHSMGEGAVKASNWLLQRFRMYGFACVQHAYKTEFAPMIECHLPGIENKPGYLANETVVIGGHFDSRGSFGFPTAPGADDDGSGTALLLSLARHIYVHRLTFSRKIIIAAFSGEEQGLLGSNWFAKELKKRNEDVVLMIQADMIAYKVEGESIQVGFPDKIGLPEAKWLVANVTQLYVPELKVGYTPACCSDHQSFEQVGYASTWVFERAGPILDPCYHNSCDLSSRPGYSFEQVHATSRAVLATLLEVGGFSFP